MLCSLWKMKRIQLFLYAYSTGCKRSRWMKKKQKQQREMDLVKVWLPKARIIRVFLDCHYLYCIVSKPFNSWQHLISEVSICVYLWFLCNRSSNILSLSSSINDHIIVYSTEATITEQNGTKNHPSKFI